MTQVQEEFLKEKEEMIILKNKIQSNPPKANTDDLVKLAHHYYKMYETSEDERSRSLCIGQAGYFGSWAVNKGHNNIEDIKEFIKYLKIDLSTPNPDDTSEKHLKQLEDKLKELESNS
ncbi:hypothetical protein JXA63_04555 [Candidatus Woesebacteria bacterium]|nr:hypothetical protein [Candidatus Woesebacteria bacterium]